MIACGSLAIVCCTRKVSFPNWIPLELQRQLIADEYYLHKKTINCHSLLVGEHRNSYKNKKKRVQIKHTDISCEFLEVLSLDLFLLFAPCEPYRLAFALKLTTINPITSKFNASSPHLELSFGFVSIRCQSTRLDSAQLGLAGLDLTRRRLMAKLVLVLFKFKFEFEFGFGAASSLRLRCVSVLCLRCSAQWAKLLILLLLLYP